MVAGCRDFIAVGAERQGGDRHGDRDRRRGSTTGVLFLARRPPSASVGRVAVVLCPRFTHVSTSRGACRRGAGLACTASSAARRAGAVRRCGSRRGRPASRITSSPCWPPWRGAGAKVVMIYLFSGLSSGCGRRDAVLHEDRAPRPEHEADRADGRRRLSSPRETRAGAPRGLRTAASKEWARFGASRVPHHQLVRLSITSRARP